MRVTAGEHHSYGTGRWIGLGIRRSHRLLIGVPFVVAAVLSALAACRTSAYPEGGGDMPGEDSLSGLRPDVSEQVRNRWEIRVPAGASREYIYTNKVATHFSGEAVQVHSRSYHGLYCAMHEYLDCWELVVGGRPLGPGSITEARCYPHVLYRVYDDPPIVEEIFLPDYENGLIVRYAGRLEPECALVPWVDMRFIWDVPAPEYRILWEDHNNMLLVSRVDNPFPKGRPRWLAVTADRELSYVPDERSRTADYPKDAARRAMGRTYPFSPGELRFACSHETRDAVLFAFGLGVTEGEAVTQAVTLLREHARLRELKLRHVERLFERADLETEDGDFSRALRWARVSMDNMIMNQRGKGIYAGFHWFPNYWGRDSFICLPGACLATGAFEDARQILLSFVGHQQSDPSSRYLGRFPNIVNPENLQYAGVDGTWWLVRAAWKYVLATGDTEFLVAVFPRIKLAIEGALEMAVDELGFLTHGDGETWMDAGGERSPYSPRGDRAVEVQALFHHGLLVGAAWARELSSIAGARGADRAGTADRDAPAAKISGGLDASALEDAAARWETNALRLRGSFTRLFWNEEDGYLYDHLNRDGTPDGQIRANAVLALWVSLDAQDFTLVREQGAASGTGCYAPLIGMEAARTIVGTAVREIVLPHGVASLSPGDPQFHPRHLNFERYHFDEAYHNGDVWEWLTGPMVSCLLSVGARDEAWRLIEVQVAEILREACVGTLREIQDGEQTPGREEFGGATSQAWSLAEFIRVCMSEFLRFRDGEGMWDVHAVHWPPGGEKLPVAPYRYIGINRWISNAFLPERGRIPVPWGEVRYRIPCIASGGQQSPAGTQQLIVIEGTAEPNRPVR